MRQRSGGQRRQRAVQSRAGGSVGAPAGLPPVYKHSCCRIFAMLRLKPPAARSKREMVRERGPRHLERTGRLVFETVNSLNPYCERFMQNISGLLKRGLVRPPRSERERGREGPRARQIIISER